MTLLERLTVETEPARASRLLRKLAALHAPSGVPHAVRLGLTSMRDERTVRGAAVLLLSKAPTAPGAADALARFGEDEDERIAARALRALGEGGSVEQLPFLRRKQTEGRPLERRWAATAIARIERTGGQGATGP